MQPTFSIVSPSYNQGEFIAETLGSIRAQEYPHTEHIIIDAGSSDDTLAVLQRQQNSHVRLQWISEPDQGIYDALNKGIALTSGDWIGWLNCDDLYPADFLQRAAKAIHDDPELEIICGDAEQFRDLEDGRKEQLRVDNHYRGSHFLPTPTNLRITHLNSCLIRKTLLDRIGAFDDSYRIIGDRDYAFRIMTQGPRSTHLGMVTCRYRSHLNSITMSSLDGQSKFPVISIDHPFTDEMLRLTQAYMQRQGTPKPIKEWCSETHARLCAETAARSVRALKFGDAIHSIIHCLKTHRLCSYFLARSLGSKLRSVLRPS